VNGEFLSGLVEQLSILVFTNDLDFVGYALKQGSGEGWLAVSLLFEVEEVELCFCPGLLLIFDLKAIRDVVGVVPSC
jgi:hypothetical protein